MYEDTVRWILRFFEADGDFRSTFSDVWCTYAAVKTLSSLNSRPRDPKKCIRISSEQSKSRWWFWMESWSLL